MNELNNKRIFASWSGGKDSCLALYDAGQDGALPQCLLTMLKESGERTRSHGLDPSIIRAQAGALSLPLVVRNASWDNYEKEFLEVLHTLKAQGVEAGVFGDIDLEAHREWVERVCAAAGLDAFLPLWQQERRHLLARFLGSGFSATIVAVKDELLPQSFLGRRLDAATISDLEGAGVDACGEEGEYHTVVTDGPLFSRPVILTAGEIFSHDGYSFLDMRLAS